MATDLNLNQLMALGNDQIVSQFIVRFPNGIPGSSVNPKLLSLRMDQSFEIPQRTHGTYEIFFQGLKVVKNSVVDQTDKKFTLSFRLDGNWQVWDALNKWYTKTFDDITGVAAPEQDVSCTMLVDFYANKQVAVNTFTFSGVRIVSIKPGNTDPTSGDPMRCEVELIYHKYESAINSGGQGPEPILP
jgi:hypothetical protein